MNPSLLHKRTERERRRDLADLQGKHKHCRDRKTSSAFSPEVNAQNTGRQTCAFEYLDVSSIPPVQGLFWLIFHASFQYSISILQLCVWFPKRVTEAVSRWLSTHLRNKFSAIRVTLGVVDQWIQNFFAGRKTCVLLDCSIHQQTSCLCILLPGHTNNSCCERMYLSLFLFEHLDKFLLGPTRPTKVMTSHNSWQLQKNFQGANCPGPSQNPRSTTTTTTNL